MTSWRIITDFIYITSNISYIFFVSFKCDTFIFKLNLRFNISINSKWSILIYIYICFSIIISSRYASIINIANFFGFNFWLFRFCSCSLFKETERLFVESGIWLTLILLSKGVVTLYLFELFDSWYLVLYRLLIWVFIGGCC